MQSAAATPAEYLANRPADRKQIISELRQAILQNIPEGFEEQMSYGIFGYVVPHSIYPSGYHCDPRMPLPFLGLASQKNHIGFYHMGIYSDEKLMKWFTDEWPKHNTKRPDMGKSCIRFKKAPDVPVKLLAELCTKMTPADWITQYESVIKPAGR